MTDEKGRGLTRTEFDAVIRRAAELASSDPEASEGGLTETELYRIAGEVGLDEAHVRRALVEVRSGPPLEETGRGVIHRVFGPGVVRVSRVVPGTVEALSQKVDDYMVSTQLLQRVRRSHAVLQYRQAADWASQVARATGMRKYFIASARSVEVQLDAIDSAHTSVTLTVEPGTRGNDVAGAIVGGALASGAAGTGSAIGAAVLLASGAIPIAVGVAVATGVWSAIFFGTGAAHRKKVDDVRTEAEGVLDALETGTSLEPPPPAWRNWVKRHLRGVARDILGEEPTKPKRSEP
jgi:hypothetical protein